MEVLAAVAYGYGVSALAGDHLDLIVFLLVGLLAGAHCLGMCGPLVTTYADRIAPHTRAELTVFEVRQHGLFNLGRAVSYALIGGLFGTLGGLAITSADTLVAAGDTVRGTLGIVVGLVIVLTGVYYLRGRAGLPHGVPIVGSVFRRISTVLAVRIDRLVHSPGIVGLGAIHGLLPCPIIYPAYLYAFALGDPVRGALSLGILGLGTIPSLFFYATLVHSIDEQRRLRLHRILGVAFIGLGYIPLQHGLMLYGIHLPHPSIPFYQPLT